MTATDGRARAFVDAVEDARRTATDAGLDGPTLLWGLSLFVATLVATLGAVVFVLVRLPEDYFLEGGRTSIVPPGAAALLARVGKNLVGAALVVVGALLSIPGVPGQGLLTILIGLMLLDFPGKRRLEQRIARLPRVLPSINRLRARFHRPPLALG